MPHNLPSSHSARPASAHAVTPLSYWPETPAPPQASFPESPHRDISVRRHCLQQTKKKAPSPCEVTCYPYKSTFQYSSDKDTCYPRLSPHPYAHFSVSSCVLKRFLRTTSRKTTTTCAENVLTRTPGNARHDILTLTPGHTEHDVLPSRQPRNSLREPSPGGGGDMEAWTPPHQPPSTRPPPRIPRARLPEPEILRIFVCCQRQAPENWCLKQNA